MDAEEFVKAFKDHTRVEMELGSTLHVVERRRVAGRETIWVHQEFPATGRRGRGGEVDGEDEHTEFDLWDLARWFQWAASRRDAGSVRTC